MLHAFIVFLRFQKNFIPSKIILGWHNIDFLDYEIYGYTAIQLMNITTQ